jgi:hypothetical protein
MSPVIWLPLHVLYDVYPSIQYVVCLCITWWTTVIDSLKVRVSKPGLRPIETQTAPPPHLPRDRRQKIGYSYVNVCIDIHIYKLTMNKNLRFYPISSGPRIQYSWKIRETVLAFKRKKNFFLELEDKSKIFSPIWSRTRWCIRKD